ncbi:MAG: enoyl-CoA hydratase/isomerase family protein [Chloroflexi bacterium]|nr:enoyl-CoA hydratase/isomerase family protein [Chloroflexota bacterium]
MSAISLDVDSDGVGVLSVSRPRVRNALNWEAMAEFAAIVEQAAERALADMRALIVSGAGGTFISGGDIAELQKYPGEEDGLRLATVMGDALARLEALPCPTIAAMDGAARGGGCEVAVACDLRVMAEDADAGFVHTRLGIITAWGGGQRLLRLVGYARALDLLTTGRVISAAEALALGLASRLAPAGEALNVAREWARQIAANPPAAVRAAKRILRIGLTHPNGAALDAERAEFPALWATEERRAAVARFLRKVGRR